MKKSLLKIASCVLVAAMLVGCAEKSETTKKKKKTKKTTQTEETEELDPTDDPSEDPSDEPTDGSTQAPSDTDLTDPTDTEASISEDVTDTSSETTDLDPSQIQMPELEWCQVYNPNGFNTVTGLIYNPNSVAIDVTYDLVYYKNGQEVARNEQFSNFSIGAKEEDVVWANWDIPNPEDVDEVKMENILVDQSYYDSVSGTCNYKETVDNCMYFEVAFEKRPTVANIWFLLYNDDNGNEKCDSGELVVTSLCTTLNQTDTVYFETDGFPFTNYEVYCNAY